MDSAIQMSVPVDDALGEMLNWAVRYSLGRRTYAVSDTCRFITPLIPSLSDRTLWCIERDIELHKEHGFDLGDRCDVEAWEELLASVKKELASRCAKTKGGQ